MHRIPSSLFRPRSMARRGCLQALLGLMLVPAAGLHPALAAGPDDNVEWNGVSHVAWQDRRPLCPIGGETFEVRFQAFENDLTAARVHVDDGVASWVTASPTASRGPYDIWTAQLPATAADTLAYYLELTDGADVDYYSASGMSDGVPADGGFIIDFVTLGHAPAGATLTSGGGAVFKVWAPTRSSAHVRGEFNGWGTANPLTRVGEYFVGLAPAAADRQMYKYFFNGSKWNSDARGRSLNPADNLNTYIEDPFRFQWSDGAYRTPPLEEMVIYQLHVGTFSGRNDPFGFAPFPARYADVAARAAHLAELGVNAVMLNPITEFPGDESAGYNPQTQWAPEWKYGDPDDLRLLVDTLHQHGIAVLLDIVWNHFTINDNFMWFYDGSQTYFDDPAVGTPWGDQADFDAAPVRDYFADSALYWLEEYHADGFRMDGTDFMNIAPQEAAGWSLMQRLNDTVDNRWADKVVIAEQLPDDAWVTRPTSLGGAGFDAQYHDAFTDRLRQEILDAALGDPEMWKIRDIVNGSGTYLEGRSAVNYFELHDEAWPASGGQRIVKTIDPTPPHDDLWARGRVKLAQGLVLLAPGVPAFLMGSEWLEDTDFGSSFANRIDWSKKATYAAIFAYFRDLVALRTAAGALRADAPHQVFHLNESANVIAFQRWDQSGNVFVVVANFGNADLPAYRIGLPQPADWQETINSQASRYGGNGLTNPGVLVPEAIPRDGFAQSIELALPQMGLLLLQTPATGTGVGNDAADAAGAPPAGLRLARIVPSPTSSPADIRFDLPQAGRVRLTVHDAQGRLVARLLDATRPAGRHLVRWDGRDATGARVATGVYLVRLEAGDQRTSRKLVVVR